MPLYVEGGIHGYDLDHELRFCLIEGGHKCILGSAGSFILVCMKCGSERFRASPRLVGQTTNAEYENCFDCPIPMELYTFDNMETVHRLWSEITSISERRNNRLEWENSHRWLIGFGTKTEADYPNGYARSKAELESATTKIQV